MATTDFALAPRKGSHARREIGRALRSMVAAKWPLVALIILLTAVIVAAFGPWLSPMDPNRQNIIMRLAPPLADGPNGSTFLMGSDALGRDVFSRLLYGARVSLLVGIAAIAVGGTIGITAGLVAGYFGGWIDDVLMRLGHMTAMHDLIPNAQLAILPGTTHMNILDRGDWVIPMIAARLQA